MERKVFTTAEEFHSANRELKTELPYSSDTAVLAEPLDLGDRKIPNRLVCQAMEGCDGTADGRPGELTCRRYDRFAGGGAGLISLWRGRARTFRRNLPSALGTRAFAWLRA